MKNRRASIRVVVCRQLAWCLLVVSALAVLPSAGAQHYTFAQLGQGDGLLNQDVSAIVQDERGVLWVGTENGLFQADGSHFVRVAQYADAAYGSVLAMHVDSANRVWVLGAKRLVYFLPDGSMHVVPGMELSVLLEDGVTLTSLPNQPNTLFLLRGGHLQQIHSDDGGTLWTVSAAFSPALLRRHPALDKLTGLVADPKRERLWAGCEKWLCEVVPPSADAVAPEFVANEWDNTRGIPPNTWSTLLMAHDGRVWVRGIRDVLRLDPDDWKVENFGDPAAGKQAGSREPVMIEDRGGSLLASVQDGLARLVDGKWLHLTPKNGLPASEIDTMFFDRSGGLWLAPEGGGIWRWLGYGNWQHWTRSEGMSSDVTWSMLRDRKGQLWVAATDDINQIDTENNRAVPLHPTPALRGAQALAMDARGHLWTSGDQGTLTDVDPETHRSRIVADHLEFAYALLAEQGARTAEGASAEAGQRVWVGSTGGVAYVSSDDNWRELHAVHDPAAPNANVWSATEDDAGTLWFSALGGIYRLAHGTWTHIQMPAGLRLLDYPVLRAAPDGTLWMQAALPTPLLHLQVVGDRASVIGSVAGDIIGSDDFSFISIDRRGWIWVGTDLGVYVFDGSRWVHCTQEDGLISDDTDTHGVFGDADGSMWFGTASGLSHLIDPKKLFQVGAPEISVQEVRLNGRQLEPGQQQSFNLRQPELAISLFSTYYQRPHAVVFRYRLLGRENEWQTTYSGSLQFSGLPAGDYVLGLQAMDQRVHALSPPVEYPFTILPPWYKRTRTIAGGCLLLLLLIFVGWKLSMRRLKLSEAMLKQMVDQKTAQLLAEKEDLQRAQTELVETARRDSLTGLLNRSAIFETLARMRRLALEEGTPLSVIMADLDHFKSINDRFGHTVGDAVLRECAERFRETLRPGDAVGRYGGEELLLCIPGLDQAHAMARLEEVRAAIASRPIHHGEHVLSVTCSFGVAWLNQRHRNLEAVVHAADEALYLAKQNGRNRVEFTPDSAEEAFLTTNR